MKPVNNRPESNPITQHDTDTTQNKPAKGSPQVVPKTKPNIPRKPASTSQKTQSLVQRRIAALESNQSSDDDKEQHNPALPTKPKRPAPAPPSRHSPQQNDLHTEASKTPQKTSIPRVKQGDDLYTLPAPHNSGSDDSAYESNRSSDDGDEKQRAPTPPPRTKKLRNNNRSGDSALSSNASSDNYSSSQAPLVLSDIYEDVFVSHPEENTKKSPSTEQIDNDYEVLNSNTNQNSPIYEQLIPNEYEQLIPNENELRDAQQEIIDSNNLIHKISLFSQKSKKSKTSEEEQELTDIKKVLQEYSDITRRASLSPEQLKSLQAQIKSMKHEIYKIGAQLIDTRLFFMSKKTDPVFVSQLLEELSAQEIESLLPDKAHSKKIQKNTIKVINSKLIKKHISTYINDPANHLSLFRLSGQVPRTRDAHANLSKRLLVHANEDKSVLTSSPESNLPSIAKRLLQETYQDKPEAQAKDPFSSSTWQKISDGLSASDKIVFDDMGEVAYKACQQAYNEPLKESNQATTWQPHPMHQIFITMCLGGPNINKEMRATPEDINKADTEAKGNISKFMAAWSEYKHQ